MAATAADEEGEDDVARYVEDFGLIFEEAGGPRMAGRMLAYLMICEPSHRTAGELAAVLGASKASVSTAMRYLVQSGMAERHTRPGDRREFVRVRPGMWSALLRDRLAQAQALRRLAERGLPLVRRSRPLPSEPLEELRDIYLAVEAHYEGIIDDYERLRGGTDVPVPARA